MNRKIIKVMSILLIFTFFSFSSSGIFSAPPSKPTSDSGQFEKNNSNGSDVVHSAATTISENKSMESVEFSSQLSSQNALIVEKGNVNVNNINVSKTGDSDGDSSDFYGTNAAVFCYNDGNLTINGGKIDTNGSHANAVFSYGTGVINISDVVITTKSNNSGAIMVTGSGTLTANNVTAETDGNSSAPIRSDRGGGILTVNGGKYTSHGTGSPVIYSTADIIVNNANLVSTASEGVVVEGKNSVTLNNVTMESTNTKLNGNSETYKSIFIYQSMSGDADVGTSSFKSKDSKIVNNKGEIIFVTNTSTVIELENNEITNNDLEGGFLRVSSAKWGTSGKNGGDVTLNLTNQKIDGNIYVDNISTLKMNMSNGSNYSGTINGQNTAKELSLVMDSSSTLTLSGDSYITSLDNKVKDNSNINLNGYTLYVGENKITSTNYSGSTNNDASVSLYENNINDEIVTITNESDNNSNIITIIIVTGIIVLCMIIAFIVVRKKK